MTLLLTDQRPKQTLIRLPIRVPVGHVLPEGTAVTKAFDITVEAGLRWHPDWTEPRITVNAWRFLYQGDVLGAAGDDVEALYGPLLPPEVRALSLFHGRPAAGAGSTAELAIKRLGLAVPSERQTRADFILPEQRTIH